MRLALRELRRRPGRFVTATVILTLIALLLLFLGGLLDGLINRSTGALRAQSGDLIVYSSTSEDSFVRSRITPELAEPPPDGQAIADEVLKADGVEEGMTLEVGPARTPVTVVGFTSDTSYNAQGSLWASPATWRTVQNANRPDARVADDVFQSLVVVGDSSISPEQLAADIDAATGGATSTLTVDGAIEALPGVADQRGVFNQIIGVTIVIAVVVVALFFALLTVERTALYGVLKAIGARSRSLFGGLVLQALVVTAIASAIGVGLGLALDAVIPSGTLPFDLSPTRIVLSVSLLIVAAVLGCAFSLRRVLHVDPASAIGSAA